jgi:molybdate transport system regulatory protein
MASRKPSARQALNDLPQALVDSSADKRLDVLRQVAAGCSISQAAREVGISYKAAWQAIDTLSNLSGQPLVERTVGGVGGGGAQITPQGLQLLSLADELAQARQQVLARFSQGPQLASGFGLRTSMRNQLPCRVARCEPASPDDPMVWVQLQTPGGAGLTASVTRESADLLGLVPGLEVLALCKATAVNVVAAARAAPAADRDATAQRSFLQGRVERVARGADRDEVVLALDGGGHWVGFAPHPFTARTGARAVASMPYAALVVGLSG